MENLLAKYLFSGLKQIAAVVLILFGSLLASNVSFGPCGGTILANEPYPAIFVSVLGLELIVCGYFLVKRLKVESDFRVIIYLFLVAWALSFLPPAVDFLRSTGHRTHEELSDAYFSFLRGSAAIANLIAFYKWVGLQGMITRIW